MPMFMRYNPGKTFRKSTLLQINRLEIFVSNTLWLDYKFVKLAKVSGWEESPQSQPYKQQRSGEAIKTKKMSEA